MPKHNCMYITRNNLPHLIVNGNNYGCISKSSYSKVQSIIDKEISVEDYTSFGVFRRGSFVEPRIEVKFSKNPIYTYTCFDGFWSKYREIRSSQITIKYCEDYIKISKGKLPTVTKTNLYKYFLEMKRWGVFPKNWSFKDVISNNELHIDMTTYQNEIQFYNTICSWRAIWHKPQVINNIVNFYRKYNVTWSEAVVLGNYATTYDNYFSVLTLGLPSKDALFDPIFETEIPIDLFTIVNTLYETPEKFGVNFSKFTHKCYYWIKFTTKKDPYLSSIVTRERDFTLNLDNVVTINQFLEGKKK